LAGTPFRCAVCRGWKSSCAFSQDERQLARVAYACLECAPMKCRTCGDTKDAAAFSLYAQTHAKDARAKDRQCVVCADTAWSHLERKTFKCIGCKKDKAGTSFSNKVLKRTTKYYYCIECNMRPCWKCCGEGKELQKISFDAAEWDKEDGERLCLNCMTRACSVCTTMKQKHEFAIEDWRQDDGGRVCAECAHKTRRIGFWKCRRCRGQKPQKDFSLYTAAVGKAGIRRCNVCFGAQAAAEKQSATESCKQVVRKRE
jgi:hypothetical protein